MPKMIFRKLSVVLLLAALSIPAWTPAHAEEMTCPEHTPVEIDIKPGSDPNAIKLSSKGLLSVAVITTPNFEASLFTPEMAHLSDANTPMPGGCAGAMPVRWVLEDVNRDGQPDILFFFRIQDLDLTSSSTAANFMAHGSYGAGTLHILGTDSVKVVPK